MYSEVRPLPGREDIEKCENGKGRDEKSGRTEGRFRFIDLFAGIGGMRMAFEARGGRCAFSSEWDRYCQRTYFENFGIVPQGDITKIDEDDIPDHDVLLAGFPCQPFSIAGVSKKNSLGRAHGFLDVTQGTLFFDVVRIIARKRPKAFLLENVKNLRGHDGGRTWSVIMSALDELGYAVFSKVLDGRIFVPQHRERVFIAGFDRKRYGMNVPFNFEMPRPEVLPKLSDILTEKADEKYTLSDRLWEYLQEYAQKHRSRGNGFGYGLADPNDATRTLSARYYKDGSEILIPQKDKNPRRLTPRECARLQGYEDSFKIPVSDTQAYKQFGNSVVVPLVSAVAKNLIACLESLQSGKTENQ
jgi:DNA (cytosine-5)-methyltransferase 1